MSAAIHKERRGCQIAQAVAPQAQAASRRGWGERRMCEALGLGAWGLALGAWRAWLPFFFLPQPRREAALEPWVLQHVASHPKHVVRAALAQLSPPLVLVLVALPRHRFSVPRHLGQQDHLEGWRRRAERHHAEAARWWLACGGTVQASRCSEAGTHRSDYAHEATHA